METNSMPESFEPKKTNRYVVSFSAPFKIPQYVIHKTTRPSFKKTKKDVIVWDDMVFSMYDPIAPSTSQALMDGIRELRKQDSYEIQVTIQGLDPVGNVIEEWVVTGEIDRIDFGTLDWKSDEPLTINVFFKVRYAQLNY